MLVGGGDYLLNFANTMHPNLKFTESEDNEGGLSFLDMRVEHVGKSKPHGTQKKRTLVLFSTITAKQQTFSSLASYQVSYIAYSIYALRGLDFTMD